MKVTPASAAASRIACDVASSHWLPNVIVPRQTWDTYRPVLPSGRCCMRLSPGVAGSVVDGAAGGGYQSGSVRWSLRRSDGDRPHGVERRGLDVGVLHPLTDAGHLLAALDVCPDV